MKKVILKKYHITWFVDESRARLTGHTVEANNMIEAIQIVCKQCYVDQKLVEMSIIKYAVEI
jgi:REP element-mobilizing transposase RayT